MESNDVLSMKVINAYYKDNPKILDKALVITNAYVNIPDHSISEYNSIKKTLQALFSDLPEEVLTYLFTHIPLPKNYKQAEDEKDSNSDSNETRKMLLKYLKEKGLDLEPKVVIEDTGVDSASIEISPKKLGAKRSIGENFINIRSLKKTKFNCKSLLELSAEFVIDNENRLIQINKLKVDLIQQMIISNRFMGDKLTKLFELLKYLNKKGNWLFQIHSMRFDDEEFLRLGLPFVTQEKFRKAVDNWVF